MNPDHNRHVQPPAPPLRPKKPSPVLRTHKRAFFLLAFYIAIVLIPWIITAILSFRPLTKPSWTYAPGISYEDYKVMQGWARAIPVLNAVAAILAIPIISSIIAQAMVVFAQRRHADQHLSARQLFSLADRSWCNPGTLHKMLWWNEPGHTRVNWLLIACMGLVVLGAVQFPLYQLLAPWKEITIPTCRDTGYIDYGVGMRSCNFGYSRFSELGYTQVGIDLEPAQMAIVPQHYILPRMRNDLATLSGGQGHPYIWNDPSTYGGSAVRYEDLGEFVAALPSKTTTGALREHIMRLNSTASCTSVDMSAFPATCAGGNPFQASLQYKALYDWGNSDANISAVDICAPGDLGRHPWTLSRNRQELSEEVFLKITGDNYRNGVIHCTGQTTRGYFELGNVHNGGAFGPLLEKWPSGGSSLAEYQFHDYMRSEWIGESQYDQGGYLPSEEDTSRGRATPIADPRPRPNNTLAYPPRTYTNTSGPLMTSIVALFGATSWAHSLANLTSSRDEDAKTLQTTYADRPGLLTSLCAGLPFAKPGDTYGEVICASSLLHLMSTYSDHMVGWGLNETAATRLSTAMSLANQAALTAHTTGLLPWSRSTGREIYAAPGIVVSKPTVSLPGLVILSAVVAAHVFGLLCLALWILRYPTWTRTLDARAVARIVAHMDGSVFPALRTTGQADWEALAHVSGLVGAEPHDDMVEQRGSSGTVHARAAEVEMEMDMEIEMRALSVASTVGKQATSEVAPASTNASRVTLGLGAPGVIAGRWGKQVVASAEHADA